MPELSQVWSVRAIWPSASDLTPLPPEESAEVSPVWPAPPDLRRRELKLFTDTNEAMTFAWDSINDGAFEISVRLAHDSRTPESSEAP